MSLQEVGSSLLYKEKNNHWYLIKEEKKFLGLYLNKSILSHRAYVTLAAEVSRSFFFLDQTDGLADDIFRKV